MRATLRHFLAVVVKLAACSGAVAETPSTTSGPLPPATTLPLLPSPTPPPATATTTTIPTTTMPVRTTEAPGSPISGVVTGTAGEPIAFATIKAGSSVLVTDAAGRFAAPVAEPGRVLVEAPGRLPAEVAWDGDGTLAVELEPRTVRALRVPGDAAGDDAAFTKLLELAAGSTVNALVFDTKDEDGRVFYNSHVREAVAKGATERAYRPEQVIAAAHAAGLYAITRIVAFEDPRWVRARPDAKLAGYWADIADENNWEYPLGLAVEACRLGFDEIQFDYVRFPSGRTARLAASRVPDRAEDRVAAVAGFLAEARRRLHPLGCAVSADVFGIVVSSPTDQGIGQRPEELSAVLDAVSPMLYPSHYSDGWLGFSTPNDHPAEVIAEALDSGALRVAPGVLRPWLQAFGYTPEQILAQIAEAETRGLGWMLWNYGGRYDAAALPPAAP